MVNVMVNVILKHQKNKLNTQGGQKLESKTKSLNCPSETL